MKKIAFTLLATALVSASAFAAKKSADISFSNEVSSDVIHHISPKIKNIDSHTAFAGVKENVVADYEGDIIKVGVDATLEMSDANGTWNDDDDLPFLISEWDADWYVEFNPFQMVGFGFSDELYTPGAYLPVWDDNIVAGNYSTNGFSVLIRPIDGLTFGAGFDVPAAWFGRGDYKDSNAYELAFGVNYEQEKLFSVGGSIRHIGTKDSLQLGAYVSLLMIDNLVLNLGFTHSEDGDAGLGDVAFLNTYGYWDSTNEKWVSYLNATGIYGENIASAGVTFDLGQFQLAADAAVNFDKNWDDDYYADRYKGGYDFYTGVEFSMGLVDKLSLDIKGFLLYDFGKETVYVGDKWRSLDPTVGAYPKVIFELNEKHTLSAGAIFQTCLDSDFGYTEIALPISWKYTY